MLFFPVLSRSSRSVSMKNKAFSLSSPSPPNLPSEFFLFRNSPRKPLAYPNSPRLPQPPFPFTHFSLVTPGSMISAPTACRVLPFSLEFSPQRLVSMKKPMINQKRGPSITRSNWEEIRPPRSLFRLIAPLLAASGSTRPSPRPKTLRRPTSFCAVRSRRKFRIFEPTDLPGHFGCSSSFPADLSEGSSVKTSTFHQPLILLSQRVAPSSFTFAHNRKRPRPPHKWQCLTVHASFCHSRFAALPPLFRASQSQDRLFAFHREFFLTGQISFPHLKPSETRFWQFESSHSLPSGLPADVSDVFTALGPLN